MCIIIITFINEQIIIINNSCIFKLVAPFSNLNLSCLHYDFKVKKNVNQIYSQLWALSQNNYFTSLSYVKPRGISLKNILAFKNEKKLITVLCISLWGIYQTHTCKIDEVLDCFLDNQKVVFKNVLDWK